MKVGVRRESDRAELVGVAANEKRSFGFQLRGRGRGRIVHFVKGGHRHLLCTQKRKGRRRVWAGRYINIGHQPRQNTAIPYLMGQDDFFFFFLIK